MPAKKTTVKKTTTAKKPAAKKTTTAKKPVAKKATAAKVVATKKVEAPVKKPTVIVKENAIKSDACTSAKCKKGRACLAIFLLIINTVLLAMLVFKTTSNSSLFTALEDFEAMRVGGVENHDIMKEIYKMDAYRNDQKMRLETTLNALKQMNQQQAPVEVTE